jgi:hypothetical protein
LTVLINFIFLGTSLASGCDCRTGMLYFFVNVLFAFTPVFGG